MQALRLYRKSSIRSRDWYSRIITDKKQEVGVQLIIKFFDKQKIHRPKKVIRFIITDSLPYSK